MLILWPTMSIEILRHQLIRGYMYWNQMVNNSQYFLAVKMSERKAVIKNADMSEDMQQDAVDCATQALEKYNIEKDIAAYIKKEFDKKYNPTWHCIVGRNFGSYVTHETKHFIYFYLGQVAVLLFKSGWKADSQLVLRKLAIIACRLVIPISAWCYHDDVRDIWLMAALWIMWTFWPSLLYLSITALFIQHCYYLFIILLSFEVKMLAEENGTIIKHVRIIFSISCHFEILRPKMKSVLFSVLPPTLTWRRFYFQN